MPWMSAEYQRGYRKRNLEQCRKWRRDNARRDKIELRDYKLERGCSVCGYKKCAAALCFHHLDPMKKEVRIQSIRNKEIPGCVLVCANCHYEIHSAEDWMAQKKRLKKYTIPAKRSL